MRALPIVVASIALGPLATAPARSDELPKFLDPAVNPAKVYKQRVRLKDAAQLSFTPGGKQVATTHPLEELVVVEEPDDHSRVRVVMESGYVRVAFFVDPAALPMVARRGAAIVATAQATAGQVGDKTPGVRLRAGTPLAGTDPPENGAARVRYLDKKYVTADGFLPAAAFGRSYVPGAEPAAREGDIEVPTPAAVLDAPGGATLATVDVDGVATKLGAAKGGYVLVRFDRPPAIVIGFVKADGVKSWRPAKGGFQGIAGVGGAAGEYGRQIHIGPAHGYRLARGELLYAEADGPPVGVALVSDVSMSSGGQAPDGWFALTVPGPYGSLVLLVKQRSH